MWRGLVRGGDIRRYQEIMGVVMVGYVVENVYLCVLKSNAYERTVVF